ncbi:MAG TPA: CaiB/BaiF CoA-transferase family protein [Dehalococcoidia bacterium]|nr:CaiB/BaiF CoA-transferase family protein [Dehalococcoidia bacterium]
MLGKRYRVIDLTFYGPGSYAARILGDLGFDVIKVMEPQGQRKHQLQIPMRFHKAPKEVRELGLRNVRGITLDLKSAEGQQVLRKLLATADVVQEGFRPGVAKRLGVDYEAVRAIRPDVVYVSLTGYGQTGPYAQRAGHDINYLAVSGFLGLNGREGGEPVIPGVAVADYAAGGLMAVVHVLASLLRREVTGQGAYCDVSVTDAVVDLASTVINHYFESGVEPKRGSTITSGFWPWYNVYRTKDGGHVAIGAIEPWFYQNLCRALGRPDLADRQWSVASRRRVRNELRRLFRSRTREEWSQLLGEADVCFSPVNSVSEAVRDPQLLERGMVQEVDHPVHGRVRTVGAALRIDGQAPRAERWLVRPGQDNDAVLQELGLGEAERAELRAKGVID